MPLFSTVTWRTPGNGGLLQSLFTLENTSGSSVVITVRRLLVVMDPTSLIVSVQCQVKTSRTVGMPSAGTVLNKEKFKTNSVASSSNVIARGATASDGGAATAITATAGTPFWQQFATRMHSAVEFILAPEQNLLPFLIADPAMPPFLIKANEAIVCQVINISGANPATNHWFVNCAWEEN